MNLTLIMPAIIFGLLGLAIILYIIRIFLSAFLGNPLEWLERNKLRRREGLLASGDAFMQNNSFSEALATWRSALFLDCLKHQSSMIDAAHNLNLNVLARLVSYAEKRTLRIENLVETEELLRERSELMKALFDADAALSKLRSKKSGSPDWALQEFSKKRGQIRQKINANRAALEEAFRKINETLNSAPDAAEITYH